MHEVPGTCVCASDDAAAAKQAIQKSPRIARLVDESHFGASIARCAQCGQHYLMLFCEEIDWADSDDPQIWIAAPASVEEAAQLRAANVAADENAILRVMRGVRRVLVHDIPKGRPAVLRWIDSQLYIPPHD